MNKLMIIEQIEQLKKDINNFDNLNDYYNKLHSLYKQLSNTINENKKQLIESEQPTHVIHKEELNLIDNKLNLTDDEKINVIETMIFGHYSHVDLIKNPDIKLLSKRYPLFDLFLIENNLMVWDPNIKYEIQTEPIIGPYDKIEIVHKIKLLLQLCEIVINKQNKIIIILIIYDLIFKNFKFCLDNYNFSITIKNKFIEFIEVKHHFDDVMNKYNLENNILNIWQEKINNICQEKNQ